jgi:hypothetical protein
MALIATAAAVVLVAIVTGLVFLLRPGPQHIRTVAQSGLSSPVRSTPQTAQSSASAPPAISSAPPAISSAPPTISSAPPTALPIVATSSPTPAPSTVGSVTISASAAQTPSATAVVAFVSRYFSAINSHDFQAYYALLTPQQQQGLTAEQFSHGFGSSADSNENLVAISPAANGDTAATLTFTSHQNASQAAGDTGTCTEWNITLFLESNGTGYLIQDPPSSYHAHSGSCQ